MSNRNNKKKKITQKLGRLIEKDSRKRFNKFNESGEGFNTQHSVDYKKEKDSILDQSDIKEIMDHVNLAQTEFEVEHMNTVVLTNNSFLVNDKPDPKMIEQMEKNWNFLTIPKRPPWDETTTTEELDRREKESFLLWRRKLAELEENENLLLTPFEKNLEIWKQLWRVVERSQLIVQIVDARNPMLFRCLDLEKWVRSFEGKRNLLLVNKADLLSKRQRIIWSRKYKEENISYIFFSAQTEKRRNVGEDEPLVVPEDGQIYLHQEEEEDFEDVDPQTYKIYNAEELIILFEKECRDLPKPPYNTNDRLIVGMVGYPNVGKSSTINALCGQKKVAVSATPGKTKHFQTIMLNNTNITLCDCPGLVFPSFMITKAEMMCNGLLRIDEMRDYYGPIAIICRRIPKVVLETLYGISLPKPQPPDDPNRCPLPDELLSSYAYVRGFMGSHGMPDRHRAARVILKDFINGVLIYCNPPNGYGSDEFNPLPKLKKPIRHHENTEEVDKSKEIEIKDFNIFGYDNPNNRLKKEGGRKHQRRLKKQQKLHSPIFTTGKNPLFFQNKHSTIPGQSLPTSVILTKDHIQVYSKKNTEDDGESESDSDDSQLEDENNTENPETTIENQ